MTGVTGRCDETSWRHTRVPAMLPDMDRRTLSFVAIAVSLVYGLGFALVTDGARTAWAVTGAAVVSITWLAVGMLGRDERP